MRNLSQYALVCEKMLDRLKIKYSKNIRYVENTRAKSRLGLCKKTGDSYVIEISSSLLDERVSEQTLVETVLHEQLHTCYGCMKHTGRWKQLAEKVNACYGLNVQRAANEESIPEFMQPKPNYIVRCQSCGLELKRQKRSQLVKNPGRYRCGKCGGKLTVVH